MRLLYLYWNTYFIWKYHSLVHNMNDGSFRFYSITIRAAENRNYPNNYRLVYDLEKSVEIDPSIWDVLLNYIIENVLFSCSLVVFVSDYHFLFHSHNDSEQYPNCSIWPNIKRKEQIKPTRFCILNSLSNAMTCLK